MIYRKIIFNNKESEINKSEAMDDVKGMSLKKTQ